MNFVALIYMQMTKNGPPEFADRLGRCVRKFRLSVLCGVPALRKKERRENQK